MGDIKAIEEKLDEIFERLEKLESGHKDNWDAILHFFRAEAADKIKLEPDNTERNLGLKEHECRICGAKGMFKSFLAREMMQNKRDEFEYFECEKCHCLQIDKVPENLGDYYGEGYYSYALKEDPDRKYETPVSFSEKILDVGCGSGVWLVNLADSGHDNLYGCDPFVERDLHYGDRVHIRKCTIHEMDGDNTFDLVRMGDSFEHMTDPLEALISAKRLIKDDGRIEMSIPTYPNIAFEVFGPHWYQLDAPRHIFLHSRDSIEYLADKAGLEVVAYKYNSNGGQMTRSFFYKQGVPFDEISYELVNKYFSQQQIADLDKKSEESNENGSGDHMCVLLCKKK